MKPKENLPLLPLRGVLVFLIWFCIWMWGASAPSKPWKAMVSDNRILLVAQKEAVG